jgi:putative MATE family efflux protein
MKKTQLDLRNEPVGSLLWKMSLPSITAMVVMAFYNFVDIFWLSRLGPQTIAAVTIAFPIQMLFGGFGVGTGVGAGSFAARMFGEGKSEKANLTAGQIIFLSIFIGAAVIAPGLIFHDPILMLFGATEDILALSREYFIVYLFTTPFLIFMISAGNLFRAEGNPNYSMYALTTAALLGAILDPFLIFGWGPFPELGISGAAYAAGISQFVTGLLSLWLFMKPTSSFHIRMEHIKPNLPVIKAIYRVGFPSMVINFLISIVLTFYNHVLGAYGPAAIATMGIVFRVQGLIVWVLVGIGHGVMPLVGFNFGARLYPRLIETIHVAVRYAGILAIVSCACLQIFADPLIRIFAKDPAVVAIAVPALRIFALSLPFAGANFIWISMFNGLGKGVVAMTLLLMRDIILLIPLLMFLSMQFGLAGVWAAQPMANACLFFAALFLTRREFRSYPASSPASQTPEK